MPSLASANYHIPAATFVSGPPASQTHVARDLPPLPEETNATVGSAKNTSETTTTTAKQEGIMRKDPEVLSKPYDAKNPFHKLFGRIESLARLQDDWNSYGSVAPNRNSRFRARRVLQELMRVNFAPTSVTASSDEGVSIFFLSENKRATIECLNSGEILAVMSVDFDEPEVWTISQDHLTRAITTIQTFLTK